MAQYYKGKWRPKNISKYDGDVSAITYRSLWERNTLRWLDDSPNVIKYSSEETIIPYFCPTDNKMHRYFVDLKVTFNNGKTFLIEIKPEAQTKEPKKKRMSKAYLKEVMTYAKNQAKWNAAEKYCVERGWTFCVWTERHLKSLGVKLLLKESGKGR